MRGFDAPGGICLHISNSFPHRGLPPPLVSFCSHCWEMNDRFVISFVKIQFERIMGVRLCRYAAWEDLFCTTSRSTFKSISRLGIFFSPFQLRSFFVKFDMARLFCETEMSKQSAPETDSLELPVEIEKSYFLSNNVPFYSTTWYWSSEVRIMSHEWKVCSGLGI